MAGGKETPRQKMIGMMYLVLTALLALNVSKEIIRAFITINDKIETGNVIIKNKNVANLDAYEQKITFANSQKQVDVVKSLEETKAIAYSIDIRTKLVSNFIISSASEMIKQSEGKDWMEDDESVPTYGNNDEKWKKLLSLHDIAGMDNYDIPTNYFVGPDPSNPKGQGVAILDSIISLRDFITKAIATYESNGKKYSFESPGLRPKNEEDKVNPESEYNKQLDEALKTANVEDRGRIKQIYNILSPVEKVENHGQEVAWVVAQFDHAPIVAAAAIMTSLRSDCLQAEAIALDMLGTRVEAPAFKFNKIEPLAFARTGYINAGDSLELKVMIAAYDSLEDPEIKYGINEDTLDQKNWKESKGPINLPGGSSGEYFVKGVIMVKERGQKVPKPWKFKYTVGEPMGVISQPEMDVLYIGYPNRVSVSASGFPADAVSISCSGCSASKKGNEYIVSVSPGTRQAKISMSAKDESGKTTSLGEKTFRVYSPPLPEALFNGRPAGDVPKAYFIGSKATLSVAVKGTPLSGLKYGVNSYVVEIGGQKFPVSGGDLPQNVKNVIRGLNPGTTIVFRKIKYSGTASGITSAAFTLN